jgi:hydroxyacylglutathione hydrolase
VAFSVVQVLVWQDNYAYLLEASDGSTALVDSPEAAPILELLERSGRQLTHIFNTHHHPDHVGSNSVLLEHFPELEIWGGRYDSEHARIPGQTRALAEGETFRWGGEDCTVREIPGHTHGHIAYLWSNGCAFVGDTLFYGGCGRLFEGSAEQLDHALYEVLGRLPPDTQIFCGHEYTEANLRFAAHVDPQNPVLKATIVEVESLRAQGRATVPSTLEREHDVNPFMRCDTEAIRRAVGARQGAPRHEVLGALRSMKDEFRG